MVVYNVLGLNTVVLFIGVIVIITLMLLWVRAEWKLAKYGESCFFRRKEKKGKKKGEGSKDGGADGYV